MPDSRTRTLCQEKAICLTKTKYGESDLILKFLTARGDVFSAIARSALRSQKRFGGGVLEPIHYMQISVERRDISLEDERLSILNEAKLIDDFAGLKTDYDRLQLGLHFVRLVAQVAREGDLHREIFNLLGHALKCAEVTKHLSILQSQFNVKFLHLQGVLPPEDKYRSLLRTSLKNHQLLAGEGEALLPPSSEIEFLLSDYVN